ncbi:MAG TPA: glycosyltransferase family 2 protein [Caulobacterales bacterium]|nr:glycosyltransferase family 2 protein [Caulobacterales bacterium]
MTEQTPTPEATPLVGVVVVAYNSRRHLARQRAALEAQTEKRWRLVVIDNASRPEERPMVGDLPRDARLIQSETNLGFAGANNRAVAELDTPFVAFLNPDAFPEPMWLAELLAAAERWPHADAFGSTQISDEDTAQLDGAGDEMHGFGLPYRALYHKPASLNPPEGETFSACAAAALYRMPAFHQLGGFDERLFCYCEDVDLGYRLRLRGGTTIQASRAVVRHIGGTRSPFADFHGARNRLWVFVKSTPPLLFWTTAPFHVLATLTILCAHLLRGRMASVRGFAAGLVGLLQIVRARGEVQRTRKVGSGAMARVMIWSPLRVLARGAKR